MQAGYQLKESKVWNFHCHAATALDAQHDKQEIATAGEDGTINIFSLNDIKPKRRIEQADGFSINAINYVNANVLVTASTGHLKFWDCSVSSNQPVKTMQEPRGVIMQCIAPHPDRPDYIATGSSNGFISIWDLRQDKWPVNRLKGHSSNVWEVMFQPLSPNYLFSCGGDGLLLRWDFNAKQDLSKQTFDQGGENITVAELFSKPTHASINSMDINMDIKTLACVADDESIVLKYIGRG